MTILTIVPYEKSPMPQQSFLGKIIWLQKEFDTYTKVTTKFIVDKTWLHIPKIARDSMTSKVYLDRIELGNLSGYNISESWDVYNTLLPTNYFATNGTVLSVEILLSNDNEENQFHDTINLVSGGLI